MFFRRLLLLLLILPLCSGSVAILSGDAAEASNAAPIASEEVAGIVGEAPRKIPTARCATVLSAKVTRRATSGWPPATRSLAPPDIYRVLPLIL